MGKTVATESMRANDSSAEQVFRQYGDMVYRLAFARLRSRADADDVLQEVFLRYLRAAPACHDEDHRKAWLLRTTINCCHTLAGSAWRRHTAALPDTVVAAPTEPSGVYEAVMSLPANYRTVVHLYYYEDYAVAEIAALMGRKEATVKTWLHRARARLRDLLKGEFDDVS